MVGTVWLNQPYKLVTSKKAGKAFLQSLAERVHGMNMELCV